LAVACSQDIIDFLDEFINLSHDLVVNDPLFAGCFFLDHSNSSGFIDQQVSPSRLGRMGNSSRWS
jgi:hypothetical protein